MCRTIIMTNKTTHPFDHLDNVGIRDFLLGFTKEGEEQQENNKSIITSQVLVGNLVKRFYSDICYTSIGPRLLLFLNPTKPLSIYSDQVKEVYFRHSNSEQQPPHVYSLINHLLQAATATTRPTQTLLLTGEAGSGKSLNFFQAIDYIRYCQSNSIGNLIFFQNILLNCFGNSGANDSTRFLKVLTFAFDFRGGLVGGWFGGYHLEKWRLCSNIYGNDAINDNFHIFYILLGGCDAGVLKSLHLTRNHDNYKILKNNNKSNSQQQSLPYNSQLINNYEQAFAFLKKHLPLPPTTQSDLFRVLAAILHLGNVSFGVVTHLDGSQGVELQIFNNGSSSCHGDYDSVIGPLLGLDSSPSQKLLPLLVTLATKTTPPNHTPTPHHHLLITSLLQNIYTRLFSWLIKKLGHTPHPHTHTPTHTLSLLDFPGYDSSTSEVTMETLTTNYINEKIQTELVDVPLRAHQEDGIREGLEWILIDTKKRGEQQGVGGGSGGVAGGVAGGWVEWVEQLGEGPTPTPPPTTPPFPTEVLAKNTPDTLPMEIITLLSTSKNSIISELYGNNSTPTLLPPLKQISMAMNSLLKKHSKNVTHLRCVRPSTTEKSIETGYLRHQLVNHRVMDSLRVLRDFYVVKLSYSEFLRRYKLLSLRTWPSGGCGGQEIKATVGVVMGELGFSGGVDFLLGVGAVFLRREGVLTSLESYRTERLDDLALLIQKTFRCHRNRKTFINYRTSQITIARCWHKYCLNKKQQNVTKYKKMRQSVAVIQRCYIRWKRLLYLRQLSSQVTGLTSPVNKYWPFVPSYLKETNSLLFILFHRWRCRQYRFTISSTESYNHLHEKSIACDLFCGKKTSYGRSISHPFAGDYIRLRQNSQWRRSHGNSTILFADLINKVARGSGKLIPTVVAITTTSQQPHLLLLDPRTLTIKYRLPPASIVGITMSPFNDDFCVVHVDNNCSVSVGVGVVGLPCQPNPTKNAQQSCLCASPITVTDTKGDLILHACHLIELVTKIVMVCGGQESVKGNCCHGNSLNNYLEKGGAAAGPQGVVFASRFTSHFHDQSVAITFHPQQQSSSTNNYSPDLIPMITTNTRIKKQPGKMDFYFEK